MEGVHVLVAEDNPVNLEVARQYLADLGCQVTAVGNGQEALDACQRTHFDIVLMDCQMPVLDGLEAVRRLRAREKASGTMPLRIIAITANAFAEDRKNCLDAGMDDYLSKPFSAEQLLVKLHKWVETRTATTAALSLLKKPTHDSDLIAAMRGSRPEFFDRLIDLFTSHAPSAMGQLVTGREACNAKAVGQAAHSLKSSCGNIGAMHMSDLCAQVQRAANSGWNSEKLLPVLDEIEGEFVRVMSALAEQRAKQPRLAAMA